MIEYKYYKDLMGLNYEIGLNDCFSIVRNVLNNKYGILIPNYARPKNFFDPRISVYAGIAKEPFFKERGVCKTELREGDVLAFRVASEYVNHFGIYLGNNLFLHQMFDSLPREENLDASWMRRLYMAHYHVDVPVEKKKLSLVDVMPNYMKAENYVQQ